MNIQCAMGVNGAIVLANKYDLPFKYYCIIDQNFVRDRIALVREIVSRDLTLYISPEVLRYIVQGVPQEEIRCRICIIELILERAYQRSTAPATLVRMVRRTRTCTCWMRSWGWASASMLRSGCSMPTPWPMPRCRCCFRMAPVISTCMAWT